MLSRKHCSQQLLSPEKEEGKDSNTMDTPPPPPHTHTMDTPPADTRTLPPPPLALVRATQGESHAHLALPPVTKPSLPWQTVSSSMSLNKLSFKRASLWLCSHDRESSGGSSVRLTEGTVLALGKSLLMDHLQ